MKNAPNSNLLNQPSRCQHLTAKRRRCRGAAVNAHAGLCFRHLAQLAVRQSEAAAGAAPIPLDSRELLNATADLSSLLAGEGREFKTAESVNEFLGRLLILLAENRITPRRAAVMAYVCNLILRTIQVQNAELRLQPEEPPQIDLGDLFKPAREDASASSAPGDPTPPLKVAS